MNRIFQIFLQRGSLNGYNNFSERTISIDEMITSDDAFWTFYGGRFEEYTGGGFGFTAYGAYNMHVQYRNNQISTTTMVIEQISNGIGAIPIYGTAWSIGWNSGKSYGVSTWFLNKYGIK